MSSSDPQCPSFRADSNGTLHRSGLGTWSYSAHFCVALPELAFDGTFTLTAADGTLQGAMSGSATAQPDQQGLDAHWMLTIESGTGRFAGARGTITFDGVMFDPVDSFTVSGTIQLPA